jgi:hypothetical protein
MHPCCATFELSLPALNYAVYDRFACQISAADFAEAATV